MRAAHSSSSQPDRHRAARTEAADERGEIVAGDGDAALGRGELGPGDVEKDLAAAAAGGGNLAAWPDEMAAGIAQGNSLRTGSSSCVFIPSHWNQIIIYAEVGNFSASPKGSFGIIAGNFCIGAGKSGVKSVAFSYI